MKKHGVFVLNLLLLLCGLCGLAFTIFGEGFMNKGTFLYYTVQSNLLAMALAVVMLLFELRARRGHPIPAAVQLLRLVGTVAITLTFVVFSVLLTPQIIAMGSARYLISPGNLCVHNLVPLCAMLDWCLYGSAKNLRVAHACWGMLPAFLYLCFVHVCVVSGIRFGGALVPYFFLDYQTYGFFRINAQGIGVAYYVVLLAGVLFLLGYGFLRIARRRERAAQRANRL